MADIIPPPSLSLSTEYEKKSGVAAKQISPDDLLPRARERLDALVAKNRGVAPAILISEGGSNKDPVIQMSKSRQPYIVLTFESKRSTEQDVQDDRFSDQNIEDARTDGALLTDPVVISALNEMAEKLGIPVPPVVLVDAANIGHMIATTDQTREGQSFILLEKGRTPQEQILILSHELGHIKNGDNTVASVLKKINDESGQFERETELGADLVAARLCRGRPLADWTSTTLHKHGHNPDGSYPAPSERAAALLKAAEIEEAAGRCPVPSNDGPQKNPPQNEPLEPSTKQPHRGHDHSHKGHKHGSLEPSHLERLVRPADFVDLAGGVTVAENSSPIAPDTRGGAKAIT